MTRSQRTIAAVITALSFAPATLGEERRTPVSAFEVDDAPRSQAEDAAASYLLEAARDPKAKIEWRLAAIDALAAARTDAASKALVGLFASEDEAVHAAAMDAFFAGASGPVPAAAQAVVLHHAWHGSARTRQAAIRCLGLCAPAWDEHLSTILRTDADEAVRLAAAQALTRSTSSIANTSLEAAQGDASEAVRLVAKRFVAEAKKLKKS